MVNERYRIKDGRYVLNNKDLSRIRLTTDEYISGLQGVEKVENHIAKSLIEQNGNQLGIENNNE